LYVKRLRFQSGGGGGARIDVIRFAELASKSHWLAALVVAVGPIHILYVRGETGMLWASATGTAVSFGTLPVLIGRRIRVTDAICRLHYRKMVRHLSIVSTPPIPHCGNAAAIRRYGIVDW